MEHSKGELVFRQGDKNHFLYFVEKGLLKAFYLTHDGKEYIKSFIKEGEQIGSLTALVSEDTCSFSLVCLEPCVLYRIEFSKVLNLLNVNPELAQIIIQELIALAMKKERREYELLCLSAAERYLRFMQRTPDLAVRLTQNDIARYLGITPVALSRISSKLFK